MKRRNKILVALAVVLGVCPLSLGGYFFTTDASIISALLDLVPSYMEHKSLEQAQPEQAESSGLSFELILTAIGTINSIALGWAGFFFNRREKRKNAEG